MIPRSFRTSNQIQNSTKLVQVLRFLRMVTFDFLLKLESLTLLNFGWSELTVNDVICYYKAKLS